jgi:hypothetical protein
MIHRSEPFKEMGSPEMSVPRSSYADGIRLTIGLMAAALALIECLAVIVLANRPGIVTALGMPEGFATWVTTGAVVAMVLIVSSVLVGVAPRNYYLARQSA